ncbi:MAG: hypothetical protein LC808_09265, partial [Actinobacteria bacterium]|nr:hypothetical protein [Actinomycetota bacterium]
MKCMRLREWTDRVHDRRFEAGGTVRGIGAGSALPLAAARSSQVIQVLGRRTLPAWRRRLVPEPVR